jgi:DNA polymerase III epsilon subunit-like protein
MNRSSDTSRSLAITRPIVFLDLETTGRVLGLDRIVELGVLRVTPDAIWPALSPRLPEGFAAAAESRFVNGFNWCEKGKLGLARGSMKKRRIGVSRAQIASSSLRTRFEKYVKC